MWTITFSKESDTSSDLFFVVSSCHPLTHTHTHMHAHTHAHKRRHVHTHLHTNTHTHTHTRKQTHPNNNFDNITQMSASNIIQIDILLVSKCTLINDKYKYEGFIVSFTLLFKTFADWLNDPPINYLTNQVFEKQNLICHLPSNLVSVLTGSEYWKPVGIKFTEKNCEFRQA